MRAAGFIPAVFALTLLFPLPPKSSEPAAVPLVSVLRGRRRTPAPLERNSPALFLRADHIAQRCYHPYLKEVESDAISHPMFRIGCGKCFVTVGNRPAGRKGR